LITPWTKTRLADGILRAAKGKEASDAQEAEADALMKEYLKMLYRSRMSKAESSDVSSKLAAAIEGSLKLSQSVKFPAQAAAGALDKPIPLWFGNARSIAKDGSDSASEFSSLQSVAAFNQVYGLSIMEGNKNTPDIPEDTVVSGELNHSNEQLVSCMNTNRAKQIDASVNGEWGAECILDPSLDTTTNLIGKLKGLGVPTLSPRLGVTLDNGPSKETLSKGMGDWRPKIETLIASSSSVGGHSGPVSRLAVSQDQRFFVSGSFDSTCRVWELGKIDSSSGIMDSSTTYSGHNESDSARPARVNDIALLEKSHSVASASSDGQVHVWRVDLVTSRLSSQGTVPTAAAGSEYSRVSGSSVVRTVDSAKEGEVLAVSHFNTLSESVLTFATQRGAVHSWDLRSEKEPFQLNHPAELGYLTSMALGTDRNWMITGTSKGFIALWDVRWKSMVKLWHHPGSEPVTRLATSYAPVPSARTNSGPKPLMFVSAGSECGMFDIMDGTCRQGFRVLGPKGATGTSPSRVDLTSLKEIDVSAKNLSSRLRSQGLLQRRENQPMASRGPQMNAMVGSIGGYDQNYLITGGGDAHIRYWDFSTPAKCYTVSGQVGSQQRPNYERLDFAGSNRLMVCRQTSGLRLQDLESSRVPRRLQRGLIRAESRHQDAILDLKLIQSPIKAIVSCSRDGSIKLFK
jgi:phosphoinositide-3-kinase regulatory subunit 4